MGRKHRHDSESEDSSSDDEQCCNDSEYESEEMELNTTSNISKILLIAEGVEMKKKTYFGNDVLHVHDSWVLTALKAST